ncbi:Retinoschisin (Fragment) [Durusdinium trenchii]
MSAIFDTMASSGATRKQVTLNCAVWGMFPDDSLTPIKANLAIQIWDDICWVSKSLKSFSETDTSATSEAACRANCRRDAKCPSYSWAGTCRRHMNHPSLGATTVVWAKVTNCTSEFACKDVSTGSWYQSGLYCPVAPDVFRQDILYLKTGATPEETLYLSKFVSSIDGSVNGCTTGNWIIRQAAPEKDYIKMETGEVELAGPFVRCLSTNFDFGVANCPQPNITVPDEGFAPMVVDDPYTVEPADYWLHPCECAPAAWGMEKPVNPESFESVPGKSLNSFIPPAFELVSGQFVCPAKELVDNGVHFETETEAMERSDCEARCKAQNLCNFFWHGSQQGANTCRLYSACSRLVRELGLEGRLEALPRSISCQVADPDACWSTSLRRSSLTTPEPQAFLYWELHQQCDEALLLGGVGVDTCARPTYRALNSHQWQHKSRLPETFLHGTRLKVSCWTERYAGLQGSSSAQEMSIYCVNGLWFNANNEAELGSFSCEACVQVGASGFKEIEARNEQEIWYMNRMKLSIATEVVDNTQSKVHCLRFGSGNQDLKMALQDACSATLLAEFDSITSSDSRHVKLLEGNNQCLEEAMLGDLPIGVHSLCSPTVTAQQIPMDDLPAMLWRIHSKDHEEAGHRLRKSVIDCWGRGAIGKVDMMHLFNTNRAQTASYMGRVLVPIPDGMSAWGNNAWQQLSLHAFGWRKFDFPSATEIRMCVTYTDSTNDQTGHLQLRLRKYSDANAILFRDSFGITWSHSGLYHHSCGPWHDLAAVYCGYSWSDTCVIDWHHSTHTVIKSLELEFGSSDPNQARFFRGRLDAPVTYEGTPSANTWFKIGHSFGLAKWLYDAKFIRACVVFTDSTAGGTLKARLTQPWTGKVYFEENLGGTWSASGLVHSSCGSWHSISNVDCGYSWVDTCEFHVMMTEVARVQVFEVDFELKSDLVSTPSAYLGRTKLAISSYATSGTNSWYAISQAGTGLFINTADYPTASDFRACALFTDDSTGKGTAKFRLRRTDHAGGTIFFEDDLGHTYSAMGLYHMTCGAWRPVSSISCGSSWGNTCQMDAMHTEGVSLYVYSFFLEYRASLARDVCRFAPVINRVADNTVALFKIGAWSDWQYRLSDAPVYCPEGRILTDLNASSEHLFYACGAVAGLGSCTEGFTSQADVKDWTSYATLGSLSVVCPQDALLNGFHFEFSEGGKWIRFRYTCCHASGAPTAIVPVAPMAAPDVEGLYCPVGKDASGRAIYEQSFESASQLTVSTAWACDCAQCMNGKVSIDVGRFGTVAAGNVYELTGWASACRLYCDGVEVAYLSTWEHATGYSRSFPSQCIGAVSVEIHGGGHCGGCRVGGTGLFIKPWPKQPSFLAVDAVNTPLVPKRLQFSADQGKWCIDSSCTAVDGRVEPIGVSSSSFDVVAVSDFDGQFEGKGVPKIGGGQAAALKARLRGIKTPKRPKAPKVPKLETFTPEEPSYAAECMDYTQLWASIQESYKDATGTVTPHMNQLKAEPVYDLPETNPCEVAGAVSGTRGKIGGGDGRATPEKMPYTELDGCSARVITRELEAAKRERDAAVFETVTNVADESMDLVCDSPPNIETAPMGMGAEFQAEDWCSDGFKLAHAMMLMATYHGGIGLANSIYNVEVEDNADCDPIQAGLDRLFCDVHCVRDAVVRGDRAILRNLKSATEVTNNNMKKMVEWSVAANQAETGWLAAKMDTIEDRLSIRIQMVQDALNTANTAALQEAKEVSSSLLSELAGFAETVSFRSAMARHTAGDALEHFVKFGQRLEGPVNTTTASMALQELQVLHAKMKSSVGSLGSSKMQSLGAQFQREASNLQVLAKQQLETLGIYKEHGNVTSTIVRTWQQAAHTQERRMALVTVDRIWWELRGKLDGYLEAAELQVNAFMDSLSTIASYEHCSASLGDVQKSYAKSLAARDVGHAALRSTWRESVNSLGELAAVIADTDIFNIFVQEEGCNSTLAKQTLKQARFAVKALGLLAHRFEVGGLPKPDGNILLQAVQRIRASYTAARASYSCPTAGGGPAGA